MPHSCRRVSSAPRVATRCVSTSGQRDSWRSSSTATGALTDLEEAKMDKPAFFTATLTSTEWSDNAGEESAGAGYPYVYNLMAADAAAADGAECILAPASQEAACSCGMSPTVEVLDGMIRFYARSLPAENMTMQVRLIPGAPEQEG